jgi:hypothetical protein
MEICVPAYLQNHVNVNWKLQDILYGMSVISSSNFCMAFSLAYGIIHKILIEKKYLNDNNYTKYCRKDIKCYHIIIK